MIYNLDKWIDESPITLTLAYELLNMLDFRIYIFLRYLYVFYQQFIPMSIIIYIDFIQEIFKSPDSTPIISPFLSLQGTAIIRIGFFVIAEINISV